MKLINKILTLVFTVAFSSLLISTPVLAQGSTGGTGGSGGSGSTTTPAAGGSSPADVACEGIEAAGGKCSGGSGQDEFKKLITTVIDVLSFIVGAAAVIMIIIGGFRYVISNGDSNGMGAAKNTILYALVGLVVVLFAQVIVSFVYERATTTPGGGSGSGGSSGTSGSGGSGSGGSSGTSGSGGSGSGGSNGSN